MQAKANTVYETKRFDDKTILIPNQKATHSIIWLHGLGSSPDEFEFFFNDFDVVPSNFRIVLLKAPLKPVTINNGAQSNSWFDITNFTFDEHTVNFQDVIQNSQIIEKQIQDELKFVDKTTNIFLGGFSQGAALSLHYVIQNQQTFAGIIACSGFLFPQTEVKNLQTPIFASHGLLDVVIPYKQSSKSYNRIISKAKSFSFFEMKNDGHTINFQIIQKMKNFVKNVIKQFIFCYQF